MSSSDRVNSRTVVTVAVGLQPDAVELAVDDDALRRVAPPAPRPAATSGAEAASIGRSGRPTSSPMASSASTPPSRAATATGPAYPASIAARRTAASGTSAAAAMAASITPSSAPWRTWPVTRARR